MQRSLLPLVLIPALSLGSASAVVIAGTNFDGRTATGNTASNLNWTTNGVSDPGNMSAFVFEAAAVNLFDGNTVMHNTFVPGLNTGNGNTSWTTTIALTVLPGFTVSVESVSFDYLPVNGGQAINVDRRSDFTMELFDPSATSVGLLFATDVLAGSGVTTPEFAPVSESFSSAIVLGAGTYSLVIRGGDFAGADETGNHTGIDNLLIEGTVAPIPEPSAALLSALGLLGLLTSRRRP